MPLSLLHEARRARRLVHGGISYVLGTAGGAPVTSPVVVGDVFPGVSCSVQSDVSSGPTSVAKFDESDGSLDYPWL